MRTEQITDIDIKANSKSKGISFITYNDVESCFDNLITSYPCPSPNTSKSLEELVYSDIGQCWKSPKFGNFKDVIVLECSNRDIIFEEWESSDGTCSGKKKSMTFTKERDACLDFQSFTGFAYGDLNYICHN